MEILVRAYETQDCSPILDIINDAILHSTALYDYNPRTLENQIAIFDDKLKKGFPVLVATVNGQLVGFGFYSEFRFREAYKFTVEHSVYTHKKAIGIGVGKALLNELIKVAKQQNLHTMIGVIDSENTSSIAFHKKFGFEEVGFIKESGYKFNRWLHSVIVQKML